MTRNTWEIRHRRRLKIGLVATAGAALASMLAYDGAFTRMVATCETIVRECWSVLLRLSPWELLPIGLFVGGLVYALADQVIQRRRVRRLVRAYDKRRPAADEPLHRLAVKHGLSSRVVLLEGHAPNPAFTAGLVRPRIYLSAALLEELSDSELRAVLRHEVWHLRRRDPLRFALLRFTARVFFWLPLVRALADDLIEEAELLADDFAAEEEDPLEVAGAVVKVARRAAGVLAVVPALRGLRPIERRVRRLAGEEVHPESVVPWREALLSFTSILILWSSVGSGGQWRPVTTTDAADTVGAHCVLCEVRAAPGQDLRRRNCHFLT